MHVIVHALYLALPDDVLAKTLHSDEPSAASTIVHSQPQLGPMEVAQSVQGEVSREPGSVEVQGWEGVLNHAGVQPRQALRASHMTRVVELIVGEVEWIFLPKKRGLVGV